MILPTRDLEVQLLERHTLVVGLDEVGRGALAGPVVVGVAVVNRGTGPAPEGLRDSKLLSAAQRSQLLPRVARWAAALGIGQAEAAEIDAVGIMAAQRRAALRALHDAGLTDEELRAGAAIVDGAHNWLRGDLFEPSADFGQVEVRVKADATCSVVAAASVAAKQYRDALMTRLPDPGYGFARHKGYGAAEHIAALGALGPGEHHRRSWHLPGVVA